MSASAAIQVVGNATFPKKITQDAALVRAEACYSGPRQ